MLTIANVEMAKAWDGEEGEHWTEFADRYDRSGWRIWQRFVDAVPINATDHAVDIGCGTGHATRDVARIVRDGEVLGVDLSARMLDKARKDSAAEGLPNVRFVQADAQVHPFDESAFDLAFSSFGAMFFNDQVAAFTNIARALRPGGRLALLAWRDIESNEWLQLFRVALAAGRDLPTPPPGAPGPFGLADADRVQRVLGEAGFDAVDLARVDEPLEWGADAEDAWEFVKHIGIVKGLSHGLDPETKADAFAKLRAVLETHETEEGVLLGTAAWLITATKP